VHELNPQSCYRKLTPYKYKLVDEFRIDLAVHVSAPFESRYLELSSSGRLIIKIGYAWDGPSGPTIDTHTFMRGSLVHDALYQLMRLSAIDYLEHREYADRLLQRMCLEDGMWNFRAWYVYYALHWFGSNNAKPDSGSERMVFCAPRS